MGRDFQCEICINTYECTCVTKIVTDKDEECNCYKYSPDNTDMRNNQSVWEYLKIADTKKHFLYTEIEKIVNDFFESKTKMELALLLIDEDSNYEDIVIFIKVLINILICMKKKNAKCVWIWNA
jgi:hypothetical protein